MSINIGKVFADIAGEKLRSNGFIRKETCWYRFTDTGIAQFIGVEKKLRSIIEIGATVRPMFDIEYTGDHVPKNFPVFPTVFLNYLIEENVINLKIGKKLKRIEINPDNFESEDVRKFINDTLDKHILPCYNSMRSVEDCLNAHTNRWRILSDDLKDLYNGKIIFNENMSPIIMRMLCFLNQHIEECMDWIIYNQNMAISCDLRCYYEHNELNENQKIDFFMNALKDKKMNKKNFTEFCSTNGFVPNKMFNKDDILWSWNAYENEYKPELEVMQSGNRERVIQLFEIRHNQNKERWEKILKVKLPNFNCYIV